MPPHKRLSIILLTATVTFVLSCSRDPYESGDGILSYLHADYADITISAGNVTDILTDEDIHLTTAKQLTVSHDIPQDTTLRRLIHYTAYEKSSPIEILQLTPVTVVTPHTPEELSTNRQDPLKLTAAWLSRNHRYLNLQLGLMMGNDTDDKSQHLLQFACDSIHTEGKGSIFLSLYHDQAGIPEYYTEDIHISLPLDRLVLPAVQQQNILPTDTISLTINTYNGTQTRLFIKKDLPN